MESRNNKKLTKYTLKPILNPKVLLIVVILLNVFLTPFLSLFSDGGGQYTRILPVGQDSFVRYPSLEMYTYNERIDSLMPGTYITFSYWTPSGSGGWNGDNITQILIRWDNGELISIPYLADCSGYIRCFTGKYNWALKFENPGGYGHHVISIIITDVNNRELTFELPFYLYSIIFDPVLLLLFFLELSLLVSLGVCEISKSFQLEKHKLQLKKGSFALFYIIIAQFVFSLVYMLSTGVKSLILLVPIGITFIIYLFFNEIKRLIHSLRAS